MNSNRACDLTFAACPPPPRVAYASVAVQAEPICVAASVQTSGSVHASSATQTKEIIPDVSSVIVQTDPVVADALHENHNDAPSTAQDTDEVSSI